MARYFMPALVALSAVLAVSIFSPSEASAQLAFGQAMTDGQLLIGVTNDVPKAAKLTAGTGMTLTTGSGSITVALTAAGITSASIANNAITTSLIAANAVTTAKLYLDLPVGQVPCVTTSHELGSCTAITTATGACSSCN